jgi:jumonji domain-containing protein 7
MAGVRDPFEVLAEEADGLYTVLHVERIPPPTPLQFYREYVSQNKPVIIEGAIAGWPAFTKWSNEYLRDALKNDDITVAVTPNGRADAIVDDVYFVKPCDKKMKIGEFLDILEGKIQSAAVHYIQQQNANFTTEFSGLWSDINLDTLKFAQEAFAEPPDAVNFWMGDSNSVTSLHKDHYENLYCVIAGEKHFTLIPPTDYPYLYEDEYIAATYKENSSGDFDVEVDEPEVKVPWISVDPDYPNLEKYPNFLKAKPIHVVLKPGEVLYLPSMYYHQVSQKEDADGRVIAVNFWYDMKFGLNYIYYKFMEAAVKEKKHRQASASGRGV